LLEQVSSRLAAPGHDTPLAAVTDAARLVLQGYLDEGDTARRRYVLTSTVPALRDREIISVARYQRTLREFLAQSAADAQAGAEPLQAELAAAAVVAAHNHVLRRWLRGQSPDPLAEFDQAMRRVTALFTPGSPRRGATVAVFRTDEDIDTLLPALRHLTREA
jgi:hypothetical protein